MPAATFPSCRAAHISVLTGLDWAKGASTARAERFLTFIDWAYDAGRTDLIDLRRRQSNHPAEVFRQPHRGSGHDSFLLGS